MNDTRPTPVPDQAQLFRDAMASFPSGVTIVTTVDDAGRRWGFTATSFCVVSMDPPLVLVCLSDSAECHPVFAKADRWIIHVIHPEHADLARRFATRGADKFADAGFVSDERGLPILPTASLRLDCTSHARQPSGDHTILVGKVADIDMTDRLPAIYFRRQFHTLAEGVTA
ncbi:flavin reductase family protein [Rhodococcus jostii]|uniref:Flavin reductase ActVB n=2 Tax=Rhodococcus jostii TaxID=132919 RepID=A0A1H4JLW5_RHOJO|nr:flavin reductase family protein [Rhodococcus jostii]SEB46886.1 flavin reductase ActVB [Rhodococcus jostii]